MGTTGRQRSYEIRAGLIGPEKREKATPAGLVFGLWKYKMREQNIVIESNAADLARRGAEIFSRTARESVGARGRFAVALSGGSTPRGMHRLLGKEPFLSDIPWDRTDIFWVDERFVPPNNPASNYGTAEKDLLDRVPIPSGQIHPVPTASPPDIGALLYQKELMNYFKSERNTSFHFDLIVLGIGTDGHTASLFPGQSSLDEKEKWVVAVKGGKPNVIRLTLTYPVLNSGRCIVFLACGKKKADIVKKALKDNESKFPAQRIQPLEGKLFWLLDREAASLLEG